MEEGRTAVPYSPITIEDVTRQYPPRPCELWARPRPFEGPVLAIGQACWESPPAEAFDNRIRFIEAMCREIAPGNLWISPVRPRMVYPLAPYWSLASMFATEREQKRRFDWFLWADDDAEFSPQDALTLFKVAAEKKLKFLAAVPYDRNPPHHPAVHEKTDGHYRKWVQAPPSGSYEVALVGFLLAIFHRSVFDLVPEPWFGVVGPMKGFSGTMPDWWWCLQMERAGLKPWVCCDTNVVHLGAKERIGRKESEQYGRENAPPPCAVKGKLPVTVSTGTGARVSLSPVFQDGRVSPADGVQAPRPVWSKGTVVVLTCERDKRLMELCSRGVRKYMPGAKLAVLQDKEPNRLTELPPELRELSMTTVPWLRKVFDLPWMAETDEIYCMDSDCFLFAEPLDWRLPMHLVVAPGEQGKVWLQTASEIWRTVAGFEIPDDMIFCGGCWSARRSEMFEPHRDIAVAYAEQCVRLGLHKEPHPGVVMEQCLLNGLWRMTYGDKPEQRLDPERYPLYFPNPNMVLYHISDVRDTEDGRRMVEVYDRTLTERETVCR